MQFKTLVFCFCGCLLSIKAMAEDRQAREQAQQESRRQREEQDHKSSLDINFVSKPKLVTVRRGGTSVDM